jgi:hypothetical protein
MRHRPTDDIRVEIWDSSNVQILEIVAYTPGFVLDTEVEIELNWDITSGGTYFFINGELKASSMNTGVRTAPSTLRIGNNYSGSLPMYGKVDDLVLYNSVQHTANYTPGYTIPDNEYEATKITLPEMEYTGPGTLVAVTAFASIFGGTPRLTLEIGQSGDELYWDGAAWSVSSEDYSEATPPGTFQANAASLPVNGEIYGQFNIYFDNADGPQGYFDNLSITLTGQTYPVTDPSAELVLSMYINALLAFSENAVVVGSDGVRYDLKKDDDWTYYDGNDFVVTDGQTYAETNLATEIEANKAAYTSVRVLFKALIFLHSEDGTTTPEIESISFSVAYAGDAKDSVNVCRVWFMSFDADDDIRNRTIGAKVSTDNVFYKENIQVSEEIIESSFDTATGFLYIDLYDNVNMEKAGDAVTPVYYQIYRKNGRKWEEMYKISVPESNEADVKDIVVAGTST